MTYTKAEQQEAIDFLKSLKLYNGKIKIVIKSVSRSGMSRRMRVYTKKDNDISWEVSRAINWPINDVGILIQGCGMDMTLALADHLTYALYGRKCRQMKSLKGNGGGMIDWIVL